MSFPDARGSGRVVEINGLSLLIEMLQNLFKRSLPFYKILPEMCDVFF